MATYQQDPNSSTTTEVSYETPETTSEEESSVNLRENKPLLAVVAVIALIMLTAIGVGVYALINGLTDRDDNGNDDEKVITANDVDNDSQDSGDTEETPTEDTEVQDEDDSDEDSDSSDDSTDDSNDDSEDEEEQDEDSDESTEDNQDQDDSDDEENQSDESDEDSNEDESSDDTSDDQEENDEDEDTNEDTDDEDTEDNEDVDEGNEDTDDSNDESSDDSENEGNINANGAVNTARKITSLTEAALQKSLDNQARINQTGVWYPTNYQPGDITSSPHEVQLGDTLWEIAEGFYGSGFDYVQIVNANSGSIGYLPDGSHALITPGTVLHLPSK